MLIKILGPLDANMWIRIGVLYSLEADVVIKIVGPYSSETNMLKKQWVSIAWRPIC